MPSAVDRVRFSRFVERALATARARGMTAVQIEQATKIRLSTIHRWRRGEIAPTVDKVRQFCAGLGVSPTEALAALGVVERDPQPPEPIMDPTILSILRKLQDPNVPDSHKVYLRTILEAADSTPVQPRKRRAG